MTTTTATLRPVPACTDADCDFHDASCASCTCPDAVYRNGGSYRDEQGRRICKHVAHRRQARAAAVQARQVAEVATRAQASISRLFFPEPAKASRQAPASPYALQLL